MASKRYYIHVRIKDKKGNEIENAKPVLSINGTLAKLEYDKEDGHNTELTESGDYVLKISANGYSPIEQGFVYRGQPNNMTFVPDKKFWYAEVNLSRQRGKVEKEWSCINFAVSATMYEPQELVMVAGHDYPTSKHSRGGGVNFEQFCDSRVRFLERKKIIDSGSIVTYFCFKDGIQKNLKKSHSGKWAKTSQMQLLDGAPRLSEYVNKNGHLEYETTRNTISMVDVYQYISYVGSARPGTIKELSIFSHSCQYGPILLNSTEKDEYRSGENKNYRDPADHDARIKDFNTENGAGFIDDFKKAFHKDGTVRVWGCLYNSWKDMIPQIIRAKDGQTMKLTYVNDDNQTITLERVKVKGEWKDLTKELAHQLVKKNLMNETYMGACAKATGVKTYGALLGMGACYGYSKGMQYMYINQKALKNSFDYYQKYLSLKFDEFGYGLYDPEWFKIE